MQEPMNAARALRALDACGRHENGQWVSQTTTIPVRAGGFHCLDLAQARSNRP